MRVERRNVVTINYGYEECRGWLVKVVEMEKNANAKK